MKTLTKLDHTQQERADLETRAGRAFVVRYVVTYVNGDGQRALAHAQQGRQTYEYPEEALAWIVAAKANNSADTLRSVYRDVDKLQVRAAACYPGHYDPIACYFDSDEENPDLFVAGVAFELWYSFTASEQHGVSFGLFPAPKMAAAEERLGIMRNRGRELALKLMELAAHTARGVSLSSLSRVVRTPEAGGARRRRRS